MAGIRPFERADLPAVAKLLQANLPPWTSEERIPQSLAGTYLDAPWADDDLPSLVATDDDGTIIGFVGSQVRRFRFGDRTLRGVCPSHLTVDPERRGGAAGALLLRRLLTGGQEFTYSDTANEEVVRLWQAFGGQLDAGRACDWMVVLRRGRMLRALATSRLPRRPTRGEIPVRALPFGAAKPWSRQVAEPEADVIGEDVDAAGIVEHLPELLAGFRLRVDYDEPFLSHLFAAVEEQFGDLVRRLVRRDGQALGWYVYVPGAGGVSRALQVVTRDRDGSAVVGDLLAHARETGSAVISGRLEPHLVRPLQSWAPVLGFARQPVVHSHDSEILATLATANSLLTQLDSEWFVS